MRAITAESFPNTVDLPTPEPGPGEVLIRVGAAGINRADLLQAAGQYPVPDGRTPVLGLEAAGTVEKVGDGVDASLVGTTVAALLQGGAYAEYVTVPASLTTPVDDVVQGASWPEALYTSWFNLVTLARLQPGETALIHGGSGGVGHVAVQLAKALGARVLTTCGSEAKAEFCRGLGADVALDYHGDVPAGVADATDGHGVDVILDVLGAGGLPPNLKMLAHGGRIAVIGLQKGRKGELDLNALMAKRGTLMGALLRHVSVEEKAQIVADATPYAARIRTHIHEVVPFEDAARAHELMNEDATIGKIVLEV